VLNTTLNFIFKSNFKARQLLQKSIINISRSKNNLMYYVEIIFKLYDVLIIVRSYWIESTRK